MQQTMTTLCLIALLFTHPVNSLESKMRGMARHSILSGAEQEDVKSEEIQALRMNMEDATDHRVLAPKHVQVCGSGGYFVFNPDESFRSYSSVVNNAPPGTTYARSMLDSPMAWSAGKTKVGEFMVIDMGVLSLPSQVVGLVVQARKDRSGEYIKTFTVSYSNDGTSWTDLKDTYTGDSPHVHDAEVIFESPITARYVKIVVQSWETWISMRAGLLLCKPCNSIISNPPDASRTFSSALYGDTSGNGYARSMLDSPQAWSPATNSKEEFVQMDLGEEKWVSGVVSQAREDMPIEFASQFKVATSLDGTSFVDVPGLYAGSTTLGKLESMFPIKYKARYVRMTPKLNQTWSSTRTGVLVCETTATTTLPTTTPTTIPLTTTTANTSAIANTSATANTSGVDLLIGFALQKTTTANTTITTTEKEHCAGWKLVGCKARRPNTVFPSLKEANMTREVCLQFCKTGYAESTSFGLESGDTCYCFPYEFAATSTSPDTSACDIPCVGDSKQMCGGEDVSLMYEIDDCQKEVVFCRNGSGIPEVTGAEIFHSAPYEKHMSCANLQTVYGDNVNNKHCEVKCIPGFKLTRNDIICELEEVEGSTDPYAVWHGDAECEPYDCGVPDCVAHATNEEGAVSYPNSVKYTCTLGYTTDGTPTGNKSFFRACQASGELEDPQACMPIVCGVPPVDPFGDMVSPKDWVYNFEREATYYCKDGYTLDGDSAGKKVYSKQCLAGGKFEDLWKCLPVSCGPSKTYANATLTSKVDSIVSFPTNLTYRCEEGFSVDVRPQTVNNSYFISSCTSGGKYSVQESECKRISCGSPKQFNHSTFESDEFLFFKDTVTYTCDPGYTTDSQPKGSGNANFSEECGSTGQFLEQPEQCLPVQCPNLPVVPNATLVTSCSGSPCVYLEEPQYTCNPGFSTYQGDDPRNRSNEKFTLKCLANGQFEVPPTCYNIDNCQFPFLKSPGEFGTCVDNDVPTGKPDLDYSTVCVSGYEVTERSTIFEGSPMSDDICTNINDCPSRDSFAYKCGDHQWGHSGNCTDGVNEYSCDCSQGFEVVLLKGLGNSNQTCIPKTCGEVPTVADASFVHPPFDILQGYINETQTLLTPNHMVMFEPPVKYKCDTGFTLNGKASGINTFTMACVTEGGAVTLSYAPTCLPVTCGAPYNISNAKPEKAISELFYAKAFANRSLWHVCDEGYTNDTQHVYVPSAGVYEECYANGSKSPQLSCVPVNCGAPPAIAFANVTSTDPVHFGDQVQYVCLTGYSTDGSIDASAAKGLITCDPYGKLAGITPCQPIKCGYLPPNLTDFHVAPIPDHDSKYFVYPETAQYKTFVGYTLGGAPDGVTEFGVQCRETGPSSLTEALNQILPNVKPVRCGSAPHVPNSQYDTSQKVYMNAVVYSCDQGHSVDGEPAGSMNSNFSITCQANGSFTPVSECKPVVCKTDPQPAYSIKESTASVYVFEDEMSFQCSPGYSLDGLMNGTTTFKVECLYDGTFAKPAKCININNCLYSKCTGYGTCEDNQQPTGNHVDDHKCVCQPGFKEEVTSSSRTCVNINDCPVGACEPGVCQDLILAYQCLCPTGYYNMSNTKENWPQDCFRQSCGAPPTQKNADVSDSEVFFEGTSTYTCKTGYTLTSKPDDVATFTIGCMAGAVFNNTGHFSLHNNSCQPVLCGHPPLSENVDDEGVSKKDNVVFPEVVTYTCETGYTTDGTCTGAGNYSRTCAPSGDFDYVGGVEKQCLPVKVGVPSLDNAIYQATVMHYPQTRAVTCNEGYSLEPKFPAHKNFTLKTKPDCTWEKHDTCQKVSCGTPAAKPFTTVSASGGSTGSVKANFGMSTQPRGSLAPPLPEPGQTGQAGAELVYQEKATYTADTGYSFNGRADGPKTCEVECQATGMFSTCQPAKPVQCSMPGIPANAHIMMPKVFPLTYKMEVDFICHPGYTTDAKPVRGPDNGAFKVICQADGRFSAPAQCKPVECGPPPSINNSKFIKPVPKMRFPRKTAGGYPKYGQHSVQRKTAGSTSKSGAPYVLRFLQGAKSVDEAVQLVIDSTQKLYYQCNPGYSLTGFLMGPRMFQIQCQHDGKFSDPPTTCKNMDDCEGHRCSPGGKCTDNPTPTGNHSIDYTCICDYGHYVKWVKPSYGMVYQTCANPDDCPPDACITAGSCKDLLNDYKCICPAGYYEGMNGSVKDCLPKSCGVPGSRPFASPSTDDEQFYLQEVQYNCSEGYSLDGTADGDYTYTAFCNVSSGDKVGFVYDGNCQPIKCADPAPAGNAQKDMNSLEFPQNVTYTCNNGFTLDQTCAGPKKFSMTCNAAGNIVDKDNSAAVPDCLPVSAGFLVNASPPYALFDKSVEMFYGDSQNVTCMAGYSTNEADKALNAFVVTATNDCKLTIPSTCVPLKCGAAPTVANTNMSNMATDIVFPTSVKYTTVTGYTLDGAANGPTTFSTSCNVDGVFDSVVDYVPQRIGCGKPKKVDNAKPPTEVSLKYMDVAKYTCKEGYSIDGEPVPSSKTNAGFEVTCLATGEISPTKQCLPVKCAAIPSPPKSEQITPGTSFVYKNVLQFKCLPGWSINGMLGGQQNFTTNCQADGSFSATESCFNMNDCIKVLDKDGSCVDHEVPIGVHLDDYHMKCDSGFEEIISKENVRVCVNINNCTKSACSPGSCVDKTNDFECDCPLGWVGTGGHECKRKSCGTPAVVANAGNAAPEMFFMDSFEYVCKPGYTKSGIATKGLSKFNVTCEANGEVVGMQQCVPVACNLLTIDNAVLTEQSAPTVRLMQNGAKAPAVNLVVSGFGKSDLSNPVTCGSGQIVASKSGPHPVDSNCEAYDECLVEVNKACQARVWMRDRCKSVRSKYKWSAFTSSSASSHRCQLSVQASTTTPPHQVDPLPYIPMPSKGGKTTFPNIVEYVCQVGHSTNGTCDTSSQSSFKMQCTEDGSMVFVDSAHSQCLANTAGSLSKKDLPFSIFVPGGEIKYDDIVSVTCQPGYSTIAADKTKNKFEVKSTPTCGFEPHERCGPINCDALPAKANSKYGKEKIMYGEVITYQCDTGYSFDAQPWKGSVCERPYCTDSCEPYFYCLEPGKFNDECFKAPQDCYLRCAGCFGMNFINNMHHVACRPNGTVDSPAPCLAVECGLPLSVTNAVASSSNMLTFVDNTVKYTCVSGFSLDGKAGGPTEFTVTCQASGDQVGFKKCQPVECAKPDSRRNSVAVVGMTSLIVYMDKVRFTCNQGYSLDGTVPGSTNDTEYLETCLSTGRITSDTTCKNIDYCVTGPGHCGGGPNSTCLDGLLDYTCNCSTGYEAKNAHDSTGLVRLMCVEVDECVDANFKGDQTCAPHGKCVDKFNSFKCDCSEGYKAVDMRGLPNGRQRCEPVECGILPSVPFAARPAVRKLVYPQNVTYQCDEGYSTDADTSGPTSFTVACKSDKSLTPVQACLPVKCPSSLPVVKYATTSFSGQLAYTVGVANYTCDEGYTTTGQAAGSKTVSIQCNAFGNFEFTTVRTCRKVTCGLAPDVAFSEYDDGEKFFGASTTYKCNKGYSVDGKAKGDTEFSIVCNSDGNFTDSGACNPVSCGVPASYANAKVDNVEKFFKETVEVSCDTGYSVTGEYGEDTKFLIKCGDDGEYASIGKYSECIAVSCGTPVTKAFSKPVTTALVRYNESAEWKCNDIASVDGSPSGDKSFTLSCEANGQFSQASPIDCMDIDYCHPGPCGTHGTCFDCSTVGCGTAPPKNAQLKKVYTNPYSNSALTWRPNSLLIPPPTGVSRNAYTPPGTSIGSSFRGSFPGFPNFLQAGGPMWKSNGDYGCLCQKGYETKLNKEGKLTCSEDDCTNSKCGDGGSCVDLSTLGGKENAYKCNCRRGYVENTTSDGFATCTPVQCPVKTLKNAKKHMHTKRLSGAARGGLGDAVIAWDVLGYRCDKGYSTDGSISPSAKTFFTQCSQTGKLTHLRTCQKTKCDAAQVMPIAFAVGVKKNDDLKPLGSPYSYGDSLTFECEYGYKVTDSTKQFSIQCLETSKFSKADMCKPVSCGKPQDAMKQRKHKNVSPSITTEVLFGRHVTMSCHHGHRTVFNAKSYVVHCKADQTFTYSYSCKKVRCANGLLYGQSLNKKCPPGYKTDAGIDYVVETCLHDKTIQKTGVCKLSAFPVSGIVTDAVSAQKFLPGAKLVFTKQPVSKSACSSLGWFPFGTNEFCASNQCQLVLKNYGDAKDYCTQLDARLCTSQEVASLDFSFCGKAAHSEVWTSTPCPGGYYAYKAPVSWQPPNVQEPSLHCVPLATANVAHAGRCCADTAANTGGVVQPITTFAGSNGKYSVNLVPGSYYVEGSQPKYINTLTGLTVDKPIKNGPADIELSPEMKNDQMRIVMRWADLSTDLDSWTTFGPHTYCDVNAGCSGPCDLGWWLNPRVQQCKSPTGEPIKATLDRDDVDGWGPETTTIEGVGKCKYDWTEQCMIVFSVWNYQPNSETLKKSEALITVYKGSQEVDKFLISTLMNTLPAGQLYLPVVTINSATGEFYRGYAADKVWGEWHKYLLTNYR